MDSAGDDPLSPNSLFGSSWVKRKPRFEEDGLSISPPDDDSSFFSLRFGAHHKPSDSMYEKISKELGLSVEAPKGPLTPELNIAPASRGFGDGKQAELFLGTSGLRLETSVNKQRSNSVVSVITGSANESPRIIIPSTILEQGEESLQLSLGEDLEKPEHSLVAQQDVETLVRKVRGGRPTRKISMNLADTIDRKFLESVQELAIQNPLTQEQPKPHCPILPTGGGDFSLVPSLIDSIPVVSAIRDRRRKVSAPPSLNPMKTSNFFFTGGLFSAVSATTASAMGSNESPLSIAQQTAGLITQTAPSAVVETGSPLKHIERAQSTDFSLAQNAVLLEEGASQAAALEPRIGGGMGKRRPKASALREMNFWAPQSM